MQQKYFSSYSSQLALKERKVSPDTVTQVKRKAQFIVKRDEKPSPFYKILQDCTQESQNRSAKGVEVREKVGVSAKQGTQRAAKSPLLAVRQTKSYKDKAQQRRTYDNQTQQQRRKNCLPLNDSSAEGRRSVTPKRVMFTEGTAHPGAFARVSPLLRSSRSPSQRTSKSPEYRFYTQEDQHATDDDAGYQDVFRAHLTLERENVPVASYLEAQYQTSQPLYAKSGLPAHEVLSQNYLSQKPLKTPPGQPQLCTPIQQPKQIRGVLRQQPQQQAHEGFWPQQQQPQHQQSPFYAPEGSWQQPVYAQECARAKQSQQQTVQQQLQYVQQQLHQHTAAQS